MNKENMMMSLHKDIIFFSFNRSSSFGLFFSYLWPKGRKTELLFERKKTFSFFFFFYKYIFFKKRKWKRRKREGLLRRLWPSRLKDNHQGWAISVSKFILLLKREIPLRSRRLQRCNRQKERSHRKRRTTDNQG